MGYEYRPSAKGQGKTKGKKYNIKDVIGKLNNKRTILIAVVLVVAIFVFASLRSFTGFVTAKETEQKQLQNDLDLATEQRNECNIQLASTLNEATDCKDSLGKITADLTTAKSANDATKAELTSSKTALTNCQSDLSAMNLLIQQINSSLTQCGNEKTTIQGNLDQLQASYDKLSTSSAKAICCRPGITSSPWSMSGDSIVCAGDKTVTC